MRGGDHMTDNPTEEMEQIMACYNQGLEKSRLSRGIEKLELERSKEIISRYIQGSGLVIYDIGGGAGVYSGWLAEQGHEVHLFDLASRSADMAAELNQQLTRPIQSIEVADARQIARADKSADAVLLMGPLYHLTEREDRIAALAEAKRLLKDGGILIAAAITRYGAMLYGLSVYGRDNQLINEDDFMFMIEREISEGQHVRPDKYPGFIARSYFHLPNELQEEMEAVGLEHLQTLAVEGPVWIIPTFEEKWSDESSRNRLIQLSRQVEEENSIMGMSPHIISVAVKR